MKKQSQTETIIIDGSYGEGGGQILRTSLALSLITGKPFIMENIRAKRKKPGLLRQHLTAVNAAAEIGMAKVEGNTIGAQTLSFIPHSINAGKYAWAVGTAGSATLVLQTVLPCLLRANKTSELTLEGGTHNPFAPTFDFLEKTFLPIINRMGATVSVKLERPGFYPAGGGKFTVSIQPTSTLAPVELMERGPILKHEGIVIISQIPHKVAEIEIATMRSKLSWGENDFRIENIATPRGPGNVLMAIMTSKNITEVFTGFGERTVPSDKVALGVIEEVREYLAANVPVGRHLADQLMIPMALAGSGRFRTLPLTRHSLTNIDVLKKFLDVEITVTKVDRLIWDIEFHTPTKLQ